MYPAPPVTVSALKVTDFTKVLLRIFSVTSFKSSIASVTFVEVSNPWNAPAVVRLLSVGVPSVICIPVLIPPPDTCASTYAFVDKSCACTGSKKFLARLASPLIVPVPLGLNVISALLLRLEILFSFNSISPTVILLLTPVILIFPPTDNAPPTANVELMAVVPVMSSVVVGFVFPIPIRPLV